MEDSKENSHDGYHDAVQVNEFILVLHNLVPPSGAQLGNTVDTTGEEGDLCDEETSDEELEATC